MVTIVTLLCLLAGKQTISLVLFFDTLRHEIYIKMYKSFFRYSRDVQFCKYKKCISLSICCRFIIYKLPRYKIGEVGSGVDYMYLDSSEENWRMSKFMVNISQGAIGNTLNQLYMGKAYKVRLCPCSLHAFYTLIPVYRKIETLVALIKLNRALCWCQFSV